MTRLAGWRLALALSSLLATGAALADDEGGDGDEEDVTPPPLVTRFSIGVEYPPVRTDADPTFKGPRSGKDWLQLGYDRKAEGDLDGAREAFVTAREWGEDPQVVHLELGFLALQLGDDDLAKEHFREAHHIARVRARLARGQLMALPRLFWGELYADVFAWARFAPERGSDLVPTARVRGYIHPIRGVDLDFYVFVQVSRDTASGALSAQGYPLIYADNTFMTGGGVQFRFWQRRIGLFLQVGPAVNLLDDGRDRVWLDLRGGAFAALETSRCRPELIDGGRGVGPTLVPCAEAYGEVVYVSRFSHNVIGQLRGRVGLTYLLTGPVAWQPEIEGRMLKDLDNDYYNNLADVGFGHRWRLLQPFSLDLMLGVHLGSYFGLENLDPAPDPLTYAEFRLQAATGFVF